MYGVEVPSPPVILVNPVPDSILLPTVYASKLSHLMGAAGLLVPNPEPEIVIELPCVVPPLVPVIDGAAKDKAGISNIIKISRNILLSFYSNANIVIAASSVLAVTPPLLESHLFIPQLAITLVL